MNRINHILALLLLSTIAYSQERSRQLALSAVLQTLDYVTTTQGNLFELNPVMRPVVGQRVPFMGVKIAVYFATTKMTAKQLKWANSFYLAVIINNAYALSRAH